MIIIFIFISICLFWIHKAGDQSMEMQSNAIKINNLKKIYSALEIYREKHGNGTNYPPYQGSRFLRELFDSGIINDLSIFEYPKINPQVA